MMAPVHPKPTNTASTALRVVAMTLALRPAGTALESDRWGGHALSVARHPFFIIVVGPRESNHLPGPHVLIATVDRIGEVAFLGVLQEHREEGFTVDAVLELDLAAFEPLEHLVLIRNRQFAERNAIEIRADIFVDRRYGSAIELCGTEAGLITLLRSAFGPGTPQIVMIAAAELAGELSIQEKRHVRLDAAKTHRIVRNQSAGCGVDERDFRRREKSISEASNARWCVRRPFLPWNRASKGLRRSAEFAVMDGRCCHTADTGNSASQKQTTANQIHLSRGSYWLVLNRIG